MAKDKEAFKPRRLGKFLLLDHIASGGMAELFRAKTLGASGFEKMQAVKCIYPQYTSNDDFRKMFEREAQICSQLQHANIVQVIDFIRVDENYLLSMEYVDGKNVRQLLAKTEKEKQKIPIEVAVFVILEVCRGLDYAHKKKDPSTHEPLKIIHRDISPQNVMVSYEGAIKIVDFGIAKARNQAEITRSGVVKGKFAYMSPEQASGQESIDHRSDIFSTGIILFELLTQERLFSSDDDLQTLRKINECHIPKVSRINPTVSFELEKIVFKALAKDPDQRFQTAGEMAQALQKILVKGFEATNTESVGQWLRKLFAEDILRERKRAKQQEELALSLGQSALESVRDTLMPTDGETTHIRQEAETRITRPASHHDNDKTTIHPVAPQASETQHSSNRSRSLEITSHTQHEKKKPGGPPKMHPRNLESTIPNASEITLGDDTHSTQTAGGTKRSDLELLSPADFNNYQWTKQSDSIQKSTPSRVTPSPTVRSYGMAPTNLKPVARRNWLRIALYIIVLGFLIHLYRTRTPTVVSDDCVLHPDKCPAQTETKNPALPEPVPREPSEVAKPTPPAQDMELPEPPVVPIPRVFKAETRQFNPEQIPAALKTKLARQESQFTVADVHGKKIQISVYPEGTSVSLDGIAIGRTPFVWHANEGVSESAVFIFQKNGYVGLEMTLGQMVTLLMDRRTGNETSAQFYDFLFEYNLEAPKVSVIDIYVNPIASIYIDLGQGFVYVGRSPLQNFEILPGEHKVRLENQLLGLTKTVTIKVEEGKRHPPFQFSLHDRAPSQTPSR